MGVGHFEQVKWRTPKQVKAFTRHTLVVGMSGTGKSNILEWLGTQLIGRQKVIDLVDRGRFENMTYSLPETKPPLPQKIRTLTKGFFKPTGFKNEILLVSGKRTAWMNKLPQNVKVVSLDPKDITTDMMFHILANTRASENTLGYITYKHGDMNINELEEFLMKGDHENIHEGSKWNILRNISRWKQSGMFDDRFERLDIDQLLKNKDFITSISSYFLENEDEEAIFYSVLLKKILDAKRTHAINHKVLVMIREISFFMGRNANQSMALAQKALLSIIREGRDLGVTLYCDTQRLKDLGSTFARQFGRVISLRCHSADAFVLSDINNGIPHSILGKLDKMDRGVGIVLASGRFHYPVFFPPALNWHKEETTNVFDILTKIYGNYRIDTQQSKEVAYAAGRTEDEDPFAGN